MFRWKTKKNGIPTRRGISWIFYLRYELENQERGFLFARENGRKTSIGDYDNMFRNFLGRGQKMHPELFTTGVFIGDFSIRRSPQRKTTTKAEKNNVDTVDIKLINQWRKRDSERGTEVGLSMR